MQVERPQVLPNDFRHAHSHGGRECLNGHLDLPFGRFQQGHQLIGQVLEVARLIKLNGEFLLFLELAEIGNVGSNHGDTVGTGQVGHPAGSRRRGVGHDRDGHALEKLADLLFGNVSGEPDVRQVFAFLFDGFQVAHRFRVVGACNHQFHVGHAARYAFEYLDHGLEALVSAPLSEGKNAVGWISAFDKLRVLGPSGENSVPPHVN